MPIRRTWKSRSNTRSTRTTRRATSRTRSGSSTGTGSHKNYSSTPYASSKFSGTRKQLQKKIVSLRTINQQVSGVGKVTAFSPNNASRWIQMVNNGACIYQFTNTDFCRHFGSKWSSYAPSTALSYLKRKFGSGIKAVTRGKGNSWLVAASPNLSSRPFGSYNWK